MIGLPEYGILFTQDLIYNNVHAFLGERAFDGWSAALDTYQKLAYEKVLQVTAHLEAQSSTTACSIIFQRLARFSGRPQMAMNESAPNRGFPGFRWPSAA